MIAPTISHAVTVDGVIAHKGNKQTMRKLLIRLQHREPEGVPYALWRTTRPIGDRMEPSKKGPTP